MDSSQSDFLYVPSWKIIYILIGINLSFMCCGLFYFVLLTINFRVRRWWAGKLTLAEKPLLHTIINTDRGTGLTTSPHQFDGRCCGCGKAADLILLPCHHATCCSSCGAETAACPHCKAPVTGSQKLLFVA